MAAACEATGLIPIAIDGKSARRAKRDTATGCLTVVSAWATENRLTLGQVAVPDGSNEIGAIPELLRTLDLAGAIVTIDAAGCQVANAEIIRGRGGHYLLAVKDNQPTLRAAVERVVEAACEADFVGVAMDGDEATDDAHGRHEERYVTVIGDPEGIPADWPDVAAVVEVDREREVGGKRTVTSPLLPDQLRRDGGRVRPLGAGPLGDRERAALGPRRGVPGGRQPGEGRACRGEPGDGPASGRRLAQSGTGQGDDPDEATESRMGRRLPAAGPARNPSNHSAVTLPLAEVLDDQDVRGGLEGPAGAEVLGG